MESQTTDSSVKKVSEDELEKMIRHHVWGAAGIGLIPIPMVDMIALTALQLNLVRKIAEAYEIPFLKDKAKNTLGALVGSLLPSAVGKPLAAGLTKSVPLVGQGIGALTMPALAGASTYAVGRVFVQHFSSGGTFLTFDPEGMKAHYAKMFKKGERIAKGGSLVENPNIEAGKNKVAFLSEGCKIAGVLHVPANHEKDTKLPALVVVAPTAGVKEQTAGVYAERMAEKGFAALAFDHRTYGESEGEPRSYENPFRKCEDVENAVSFMSALPQVDEDRIGLLAVCAGASFALHVATFDRRVKALATVSGMFDSRSFFLTMFGGKEGTHQFIKRSNLAAQKYYETGEVEYDPAVADALKDASDPFSLQTYDYYRTPRGGCEGWKNRIAVMSWCKSAAFNPLSSADFLSPTPLLAIVGDKALTAGESETAVHKAEEPKELFRIPGAGHIDMYDREEYVGQAVEKMADFFGNALR